MYGCFDPCITYGVLEENDGWACEKVIDEDFLEKNNIEIFTTNIVKIHGCKYVYGIHVSTVDEDDYNLVSDHEAGLTSEEKKTVDDFCKLYNLGTPKFYLCIKGDWEIGDQSAETYTPEVNKE